MKTTEASPVDPVVSESASPAAEPVASDVPTASSDPVYAEEPGHPIGVGLGALGAGVAGAAIGAVAGPIGVLVGAVVGAVAGGIVGEEVASAGDAAVTDNPDSSYTLPDVVEPTSLGTGSTGFWEGSEPASGSLFSGADEDARPASTYVPRNFAAVDADAAEAPNESSDFEGAQTPKAQGSSEEAIRTTAYYHYLDREASGVEGDALGDWVQAEHELQNA